jgi:hypothetical protein
VANNKAVVKRINVPSTPNAGGHRAKPDNADDTKREGCKPRVDNKNTDGVGKERKGAAHRAAVRQARDTTRNWFAPIA